MDDANNSHHEFFNMDKGHYGVSDDKKLSDLHGNKKLVYVLLLRTEQQDQRLEQLDLIVIRVSEFFRISFSDLNNLGVVGRTKG